MMFFFHEFDEFVAFGEGATSDEVATLASGVLRSYGDIVSLAGNVLSRKKEGKKTTYEMFKLAEKILSASENIPSELSDMAKLLAENVRDSFNSDSDSDFDFLNTPI